MCVLILFLFYTQQMLEIIFDYRDNALPTVKQGVLNTIVLISISLIFLFSTGEKSAHELIESIYIYANILIGVTIIFILREDNKMHIFFIISTLQGYSCFTKAVNSYNVSHTTVFTHLGLGYLISFLNTRLTTLLVSLIYTSIITMENTSIFLKNTQLFLICYPCLGIFNIIMGLVVIFDSFVLFHGVLICSWFINIMLLILSYFMRDFLVGIQQNYLGGNYVGVFYKTLAIFIPSFFIGFILARIRKSYYDKNII